MAILFTKKIRNPFPNLIKWIDLFYVEEDNNSENSIAIKLHGKLADEKSVTRSNLTENSVGTDEIIDDTISGNKIQEDSIIGNYHIINDTITKDQIGSDQITNKHIWNRTLSHTKIENLFKIEKTTTGNPYSDYKLYLFY
jgi:hypothetical protein